MNDTLFIMMNNDEIYIFYNNEIYLFIMKSNDEIYILYNDE